MSEPKTTRVAQWLNRSVPAPSATRAIWIISIVLSGIVVSRVPVAGDIYAEWVMVRAVLDGGSPYLPVNELGIAYGIEFGDWYSFVIPRTPGALILMLPLGAIPLGVLPQVASVALVTFLSVAAWALARLGRFPSYYAAAAMPFFLASEVGLTLVNHRHVTMVAVLMLFALAWLDLVEGKHRRSGVFLGAATTLRLFPWVIVGSLLHRRPRVASWAIVTFLLLNIVGLALPGISWTEAVGAVTEGSQFIGEVRNGSVVSIIGLPVWVSIAAGALFIASTWNREGWNLSIPVSLLIAPIAWTMYLPVLLIPLAYRRRFVLLAGMPIIWFVFGILHLSFTRAVTAMTIASIAIVFFDEIWALVRTERGISELG